MSHKNLLWVLIFIFAGIIMVPSIAKAEYPEHGIYIGAYGGYMLELGDWKLGSEPQVFNTASPLNPKSSALM
jgi:hypothetical protein